jgi:predicted lipoprotein with Yx(FWY)xxD motif
MHGSAHKHTREYSRRQRRTRSTFAAAVAGIAVVVLAASAALAVTGGRARTSASTRVVNAGNNASLGKKIVVDAHGRTVYALSPETAHHLLCKSRACFEFWPPLLVHSAHLKLTAGPGVSGHLGVLRRSSGKFQVTLRGLPLYRFSGDKAAGQANGEGIKTFGGTWHAVAAGTTPAASPPAPAPQPAPMPYGY